MRQELTEIHDLDDDGNPHGGQTVGVGFKIDWQRGPLGRDGDRVMPNGAFVEGILLAALGRLRFYQSASHGRFACHQNATAITKIEEALGSLDDRTREREERAVEGTHTP